MQKKMFFTLDCSRKFGTKIQVNIMLLNSLNYAFLVNKYLKI